MKKDYYHHNYQEYYEKTVHVDPESFLHPLVRRLPRGAEILDAGCGSGRDLLWLKKRGFSVTGVERSPGLAALARKHSGCRVLEGDFSRFDFSRFSADALILVGSLVHIPHGDFPDILDNLFTAVRPRGYILLSLKKGSGQRTAEDQRIFYLWQDAELRQIFQQKKCRICDFFTQASFLTAGDIWLAYVLQKGTG